MNPKRLTVSNRLRGPQNHSKVHKLAVDMKVSSSKPKFGMKMVNSIKQISNRPYASGPNEDLKSSKFPQKSARIFQFPPSRTSMEICNTIDSGSKKEDLQIIGRSKLSAEEVLPRAKPSTAIGMKRVGSMPQLHNFRKSKSRRMKRVDKMTYEDINELSKRVLIEDLQRKWIKRERASMTQRESQK